MPVYICRWCGKRAYTSRNQARDEMKRILKKSGYLEEGTVYRCRDNRRAFHFTHWIPDVASKIKADIRAAKVRGEVRFVRINPGALPMSDTAQWRWIIFDTLAKFGVRSSKAIKLPPHRWGGRVNHSPWAVPATVTVVTRKRKGRR